MPDSLSRRAAALADAILVQVPALAARGKPDLGAARAQA
jgi:hypothetical protein